MKLVFIAILVLVVLGFFRGAYLLVDRAARRQSIWGGVRRYLPVVELVIWITLIFRSVSYLFSREPFYPWLVLFMAIATIALGGWFWGREFLAGVIFQAHYNFRPGVNINFREQSGKIISQRATYLVLETSRGPMIRVPYSKLISEVVAVQSEGFAQTDEKITLEVGRDRPTETIFEAIRQEVLTSPWRLTARPPEIRLLGENDQTLRIEVQVRTLNSEHMNRLRAQLEEKFTPAGVAEANPED